MGLLDGLRKRAAEENEREAAEAAEKNGEQKETKPKIECLPCDSWEALIDQWRIASEWREGLDDAFSIMLAIAISTDQVGDSQLFLMVIAEAGGLKTKLCDAMAVSQHCHLLEHITGFHSGIRDEEGNDYSLLGSINHKTLITPEGDVMISNPLFQKLMSEQRRIFDGTSGAKFKTHLKEQRFTDLRTPWIIAGTHALLAADQSRLGDRFLRVFIDPPSEDQKDAILMKVGENAFAAVKQSVNGHPGSIINDKLLRAYQLTGGYIDWLRMDTEQKITDVVDCSDQAEIIRQCAKMAHFVADFRARPECKRRDDTFDVKELPTRLHAQFIRLSACLTVVLNKQTIDVEVMRRVRKVALDTAAGRTFDLAQAMFDFGPGIGMSVQSLAPLVHEIEETRIRSILRFMKKIGLVSTCKSKRDGKARWNLTNRVRKLWAEVVEG